MEFGELAGWIVLVFGLFVAPSQLVKIIRSKQTAGISLTTYTALVCALVFYLIHALNIGSVVFTIAQSINLASNVAILAILCYHSKARKSHT